VRRDRLAFLDGFTRGLEKVTVPTLVIHGDSDAIVPFEVSAARLPDELGLPVGRHVRRLGRARGQLADDGDGVGERPDGEGALGGGHDARPHRRAARARSDCWAWAWMR